MIEDTRSKKEKLNKIAKIVFKIFYQVLILFCVILIAIIVLQKISNSNKTILGYRLFRVITGSMEPEYDIGEVVICKEVDPNTIKVGDDIVYFGNFGDYSGKIIMHEVTKIDKDENNNLNFHAKGLHSASIEDPQIKVNQIFGVVKFKSAILTLLYNLATSIYSAFIIITILVLNVFISFKVTGKQKVHQLEESYDEYEENEEYEEDIEDDDVEEEEEDDSEEEDN